MGEKEILLDTLGIRVPPFLSEVVGASDLEGPFKAIGPNIRFVTGDKPIPCVTDGKTYHFPMGAEQDTMAMHSSSVIGQLVKHAMPLQWAMIRNGITWAGIGGNGGHPVSYLVYNEMTTDLHVIKKPSMAHSVLININEPGLLIFEELEGKVTLDQYLAQNNVPADNALGLSVPVMACVQWWEEWAVANLSTDVKREGIICDTNKCIFRIDGQFNFMCTNDFIGSSDDLDQCTTCTKGEF